MSLPKGPVCLTSRHTCISESITALISLSKTMALYTLSALMRQWTVLPLIVAGQEVNYDSISRLKYDYLTG